jgi:hypothetical protein
MFGNDDINKNILKLYGKYPLKKIAKLTKTSLIHVKYVLYKKNIKR